MSKCIECKHCALDKYLGHVCTVYGVRTQIDDIYRDDLCNQYTPRSEKGDVMITTGKLTEIVLAGVEDFCGRYHIIYEILHGRDENNKLFHRLRFLNDSAKVYEITFYATKYKSYIDALKDIYEELNKEFGPF